MDGIDWVPFKGIYTESVKSVYTRIKNTGEILDQANRLIPTFKRMSVEVNTGQ